MRRYLPRSYLERFLDPEAPADSDRTVWVHRPAIGVFQRAPLEPDGMGRHFNEVDDPALQKNDDLERLLASLDPDASRMIEDRLHARSPPSPAEREVLASYFALLAIRLSSRFGLLPEAEARRGYDELMPVLRDMGWVFWEAEPPDYFVSSNVPFHVAFPRDDGLVQGMELFAPGIELTLPLSPRLALHATWKRRGEAWRKAGEDVLLELNARTILGARRFVLSPKPAIPG
jgi:uncharacterized protein DUF4238